MKRNEKQFTHISSNDYPIQRNRSSRRRKAGHTLTLNQIKLAVAMELKADGYSTIVFDRVLNYSDRKFKVHVYCEDELGQQLAVYCLNKPCQVKPNDVLDIINAIGNEVMDCDVAIAFPTSLLPKAEVLIDMTSSVFMVDDSGRVWVHHPWSGMRGVAVQTPLVSCGIDAEDEEHDMSGMAIRSSQMQLPYVT